MSSPTPVERKFLAEIHNKRTRTKQPYDRRRLWAREDREYKGWDGLSGGERKARDKFARLVADRTDKIVALKKALGLDLGPIKSFETKAEFESYWTADLLEAVAERWIASPYFRSFARTAIKGAQNKAAAHADLFVQSLVDTCANPKVSANAKTKAAQIGLGIAGLTVGTKLEQEVGGERQQLRKKGRLILMKTATPEADSDEGLEPTGTDPVPEA